MDMKVFFCIFLALSGFSTITLCSSRLKNRAASWPLSPYSKVTPHSSLTSHSEEPEISSEESETADSSDDETYAFNSSLCDETRNIYANILSTQTACLTALCKLQSLGITTRHTTESINTTYNFNKLRGLREELEKAYQHRTEARESKKKPGRTVGFIRPNTIFYFNNSGQHEFQTPEEHDAARKTMTYYLMAQKALTQEVFSRFLTENQDFMTASHIFYTATAVLNNDCSLDVTDYQALIGYLNGISKN